jgi:hypothetical protein
LIQRRVERASDQAHVKGSIDTLQEAGLARTITIAVDITKRYTMKYESRMESRARLHIATSI